MKGLAKTICGTIAVLIPLYILYDPINLPSFGTVFMFVWAVMVLTLIVTFILNLKLLTSEKVPGSAFEIPEALPQPDGAQMPDPEDMIDAPEPVIDVPAKILEKPAQGV